MFFFLQRNELALETSVTDIVYLLRRRKFKVY